MSNAIDRKKLLFWGITIVITLLVGLIPASEIYTIAVKKFCVITVFCIAALAFDILDSYVIGIGMPLAYILTGVCSYAQAFVGWTSTTTMLLITSFIFANSLERIGLLKRLGLSLILKLRGSFSKTMWALLITGIIITFITFCQCAIINIALGYAVYKSFDLKPTDREAVVVLLVTILSSCTAQMFCYNALLVSILSNSVSTIIPNFSLAWYEICLNNLPTIIFCIIFTYVLLKWSQKGNRILDLEASKAYCEKEYAALGTMKAEEKKASFVLILVMLFLFTQPIHGLDVAYGFMLGSLINFLPGIQVGNAQDLSRVPWRTLVLVFAFLGIGSAAGATGFTSIISQFLTPLISHAGMFGSIYVTFLFGALANFILSPFAMCSTLTIPIAQYCMDLGYSVIPHIMALYQSCDLIFLPYEWPAYMIVFTFGFVKMGSMIKALCAKAVAQTAFICILVIPFWSLIGLIC